MPIIAKEHQQHAYYCNLLVHYQRRRKIGTNEELEQIQSTTDLDKYFIFITKLINHFLGQKSGVISLRTFRSHVDYGDCDVITSQFMSLIARNGYASCRITRCPRGQCTCMDSGRRRDANAVRACNSPDEKKSVWTQVGKFKRKSLMRDSDWLKLKLRLIFLICVQTQMLCNGANENAIFSTLQST